MADEPLPVFFTVVGIDEKGDVTHASGRFDVARDAEPRAAELARANPAFQWVICRALRRARSVSNVVLEDVG